MRLQSHTLSDEVTFHAFFVHASHDICLLVFLSELILSSDVVSFILNRLHEVRLEEIVIRLEFKALCEEFIATKISDHQEKERVKC